MFPIRTHNRKAISVVMTTLIILVASVVLGTGVVLYGTSLFQTGGQTQSISSQGVKLWANGTWTGPAGALTLSNGPANTIGWGAAAIRNNGDVLATVNTIQIRGVSVPYSSWYVDTDPTRTQQNFQAQFNYTKNDIFGNLKGTAATAPGYVMGNCVGTNCNGNLCPATINNLPVTVIQEIWGGGAAGTSPLCLAQQSGPTTLNPGAKMIVYFKLPLGLLGPIDSGSSVTANLYAGNVGGPTTVTVANP